MIISGVIIGVVIFAYWYINVYDVKKGSKKTNIYGYRYNNRYKGPLSPEEYAHRRDLDFKHVPSAMKFKPLPDRDWYRFDPYDGIWYRIGQRGEELKNMDKYLSIYS